MRYICACCAKQIIRDQYGKTTHTTQGPGSVHLGPNQYCCGICAKDLDENGLFPEDYQFMMEYEDYV